MISKINNSKNILIN